MEIKSLAQIMREDAIRERERKATAKGMTVAEYDAWEDSLMRKAIEADRQREKAFNARKRAEKRAAREAKGAPVKTPPSASLRLETGIVWQCEECDGLTNEPQDSPLFQCGECDGYFNEANAEGDNSNKCPDCEKRGRKVGKHSCPDCDKGPMNETEAFLCPIDPAGCNPLEDEASVATHLNDEHAGEFPGEWMNDEGDLILDGAPPAPSGFAPVTCSKCGASIPAEDSIGDEGKDYCIACAGSEWPKSYFRK